MKNRLPILRSAFLASGLILSAGIALAQAVPTGGDPIKLSTVDIYAGYADIEPFGSSINSHQFKQVGNLNGTAGFAWYFKHNFGLQFEGEYFNGPENPKEAGVCVKGACDFRDQRYYNAIAGPVYRFELGHFVPFVHVMGGFSRVNGPIFQDLQWGYEGQAGAGVDYVLPWHRGLIALRLPQVDFQYYYVDYARQPTPDEGGIAKIKAGKVMGGIVLRLGDQVPPRPLTAACNVSPSTLYPGDPITVSGSVVNVNPRKKVIWTWTTTGGQLTPGDGGAGITTVGLAPGDYTVSGRATQGNKAYEQSTCAGEFTVRPFEPPTLTCSADPGTVMSGTPVTITGNGVSPQNRALNYSYSSTSGQISGGGSKVTLSTAGVAPGSIGITCNVVDDLGKTATASTSVTISAPPAQPLPDYRSLCTVSFARDLRRPARVDNEGKGCLDDVALTLNHDSTSKLVIVGAYSAEESPTVAAERALNIRTYLTTEKGIDPSRIELREGGTSDRSAQNILLPAGSVYPDAGTTVLDPSTIRVKGPAYGVPGAPIKHRRHRKKKTY